MTKKELQKLINETVAQVLKENNLSIQEYNKASNNLFNAFIQYQNVIDKMPYDPEFKYSERLEEIKTKLGQLDRNISTTIKSKLEEKPSSGLSQSQKSSVVKKAESGEDIGNKGKGFNKVASTAAKEYGSKEAGQKVAAAAMWKNIHR